MTLHPRLPRFAAPMMSALTLLVLAACGGGGGADGPAALQAAAAVAADPANAATTAANTAANPAAITPDSPASAAVGTTTAGDATASAAVAASPDELLTTAMATSALSPADGSAAAAAVAATPSASAAPAVAKEDQPTETAQAVKNVALNLTTAGRTVSAISTATRILYVDSSKGSDSNNGLAATTGTGGSGPWRSLAKLAQANLLPGDTARLLCGSEWNETLKPAASGSSGSPITLAAYPAGCSNKPSVNGALAIAPSSWALHRGSIYKATVVAAPLQLSSSTGTPGAMTVAHHPNRGFDAAAPESMYLRLAANSDSVAISNRQASTYITTGSDLALPSGASLLPGTTVRIRTNAWMMDESKIATVSGNKLTLTKPSTFALTAGWGYYLLGQLWMLDSPGEWHYDAGTQQLYAWMPDSRAPAAPVLSSQLGTGIDVEGLQYVVIDGLAVKRVGIGINLRRSIGVQVINTQVEDTVDLGLNAAGSMAALVQASSFARTGNDAVSGVDYIVPAASGLRVLNNTITDSGVVLSGGTVLSLPVRTRAAVRPGTAATVNGNSISNAGYIGIWPLANSTVSNNVITNACLVLDDCGAIYASGANHNSSITGNLVLRAGGSLAGKGPQNVYGQAQGIYLDESATGVTVSGNTVTDTDNGIHVHVSANNTIKDNKLYGNRSSQIWFQETRNTDNPKGDIFGNVVTGNQIVPTAATAKALFLDSQVIDTTRFGSFDYNRYLDSVYPIVAAENAPAGRSDKTLAQWRAATTGGVARNLDVNGSGTSQTRFAPVLINGASVVPNGKLTTSTAGWAAWNQTSPYSSVVREACPVGWCVRYITGGSKGILSSPNFSLVAGTWYRLTVDLATGTDNLPLDIIVRRGGGGSNGYERLTDRVTDTTGNRSWQRFAIAFKATKTVNAGDTVTKDLGARVDVQNILPGQVVSLSNLELVPITPAEALTRSDLLVNANANPTQANCPVLNTQPTLCSQYVRLQDNAAVTWPYYLPGRGSDIIYTRDARLVDSDRDGIPDTQDACPNTAAGATVNSKGCGLAQG